MQKSAIILLCFCLFLSCSETDQDTGADPALAIVHVNVIDVADGSVQPEMTVLVEANKIKAVGKTRDVLVPSGATVVDGTNGYLIPGLWDMHVHALHEEDLDSYMTLFVVNGVTGFRDCWGEHPVARKVRSEVAAGERMAPRFIVAGHLVDGADPLWPGSNVVTTPEEARQFVDEQKEAGADFIKVYIGVSPDAYFALAERARTTGIPFAGHIPRQVGVADASDAGQRCIEHVYDVLRGCSTEEEQLLKSARKYAEDKAAGKTVISRTVFLRHKDQLTLATQDDALTRDLMDRFVRNETWQVPTLVAMRGFAFQNETTTEGLQRDPRSRYFKIPDFWLPENDPLAEGYTDEDWDIYRSILARILEVVALMQQTGVPLLAGTDTPNPGAYPGFGLHDELQLLVEAGLSPLQALQAATLNAARFMHAEDSLGQVVPGMLADLVLLEANPLSDIANTSRIRSVVLNGALLDRNALDSLLDQLAGAAAEKDTDKQARDSGTGGG